MKFKALPVTDFPDATLDFEQLQVQGVDRLNSTTVPLTGAAWSTPALINSWTANTPVRYLKDPLGFVHFRGSLATGTSATVAFVLPAGFRPVVTDFWPVLQSSGLAGAFVNFATNGNVTPTYGGVAVYLNNLTFLAEG